MYLVLFEEAPNANHLFQKTREIEIIKSENAFYKQRFNNDKSNLPKDEDTIELDNLYLKTFLSTFKRDIIKKPNSYFYNVFHKNLKKYLYATETKKKNNKSSLKNLNSNLLYPKKARENLDNFDNLLYPDDIYKVEKTVLNKILNIIIFTENKKVRNESDFDISKLCNLKSEDEIYFNDNFKEIFEDRFKLLKYLKLITMTYDLVVKHFYLPKNISFDEKNAYLGFYLQKFSERQFNQIQIQFLNQNISEIKDSLFENDVLKLLEFNFDISERSYALEGNFDLFVSDETLSVRNEVFNDENDFDEFTGNHKKRNKNNNKNNHNNNLTTLNTKNNNNNTKRFNTNFNNYNYINETNNANQTNGNKSGFNNVINNTIDNNLNNKGAAANFDSKGKLVTEESIELLPSFKEKCLKVFSIWNTLFIVLFRKNFKYVKFLENLSFSKLLVTEYMHKLMQKDFDINDVCFKSPFLYLFSRLFFLEQPLIKENTNNNNINKNDSKLNNKGVNFVFKKIDKNIKKLNEVRLLGRLDENDIITPIRTFYADINEYLFNIPEEEFDKRIKEGKDKSINSYHAADKFNNFYPGIFTKIWSTLDERTKKVLFFGLNEHNYEAFAHNNLNSNFSQPEFYQGLIKTVLEREEDLKENIEGTKSMFSEKAYANDNNFENNEKKNNKAFIFGEFKIISFFRSEQRSHIFNYLKFPNEKFDECKKAILALPVKGITLDEIDRFKNFESLFKFINESKFSLKYIYDVYSAIFDKMFKEIKIKLKEMVSEYENILSVITKNNLEFFYNPKDRIKFIKFFKYVLSMKKYETIKSKIVFIFFII